MKLNLGLVLMAFSLMATTAPAQTDNFGVWTSVEANKKLKKFEFNGELELRMRDNLQNVGRISAKTGIEYAIFKPIKIGVAYRYMYFYDAKYSDLQPRNQIITYLQGKQKVGRFSFTLRERFQYTTKDESDRIKKSGKIDTYRINPEWIWRNRLKINYNIPKSKFSPEFSIESFYQLNNPDGNVFEELRYILGCEYEINKKQSIELFGVYDKEINVTDPEEKFAVGIGYVYAF